jgi:HJR/Mrr/RecB family endonuclease
MMDDPYWCSKHDEKKLESGIEKKINVFCFSCMVESFYLKDLQDYNYRKEKYNSLSWFDKLLDGKFNEEIPSKNRIRSSLLVWTNNVQKNADLIKKKLKIEYIEKHPPSDFNNIDQLKGTDFEELISNLFKKNGYMVTKTSASGDNGVDLVVKKKTNAKIVESIAIQCKRYKAKVGISAVQEVFTGKHVYRCKSAMVITTSQFSNQAIKTAEKLKVTLWDRQILMDEYSKIYSPQRNVPNWDSFLKSHYTFD